MKDKRGQALLEIVVAITLIVVVASGIAVVTVNSLKNSSFSQNQTQATKYAQEALERVKAIRARNCPVVEGPTTHYYWFDNSSLVWDVNLSSTLSYQASIDPGCLITAGSEDLENGKFKKEIFFSNEGRLSDRRKKVIARVSWSDFSGPHKSELVTILADY